MICNGKIHFWVLRYEISQFFFSLLRISPISAFRQLRISGILNKFCEISLKKYFVKLLPAGFLFLELEESGWNIYRKDYWHYTVITNWKPMDAIVCRSLNLYEQSCQVQEWGLWVPQPVGRFKFWTEIQISGQSRYAEEKKKMSLESSMFQLSCVSLFSSCLQ